MVELERTQYSENPGEVDLQKKEEALLGEEKQNLLSISRQLVLDVCEPFLFVKTVQTKLKDCLRIYQFGSFEVGDEMYIFGTEENQYHYSLKHEDKRLPVIIAKVYHFGMENEYNEMIYSGGFSERNLVMLADIIQYTLESQQVAAKYLSSHC